MPKHITYSGMIGLLAAQVTVMLPLLFHLPLWLLPVLLFTAGWRLRVIAGKAEQPSQLTKILLLASGLGGLLLSGMQFPSLDAMASLLLLGFAFKALEVVQRRDALVVIFIGYFLVALSFLYDQSLLAGLYGGLAMIILTAALIGVQQQISAFSTGQSVRFNLRLAVFMLLQTLPLLMVLFVFAPRLAPLWSLPLPSQQALTGMSDKMRPGDIEKLAQSHELAFRVTFQGVVPAQNELYWRGLVLNHFDGVEWRQFAHDYRSEDMVSLLTGEWRGQAAQVQLQGDALAYEAIYEPSGQPWLFTLTPSVQVSGEVLQGADFRVMARQALQAPFMLKATSYPQARLDVQLSESLRAAALQLPPQTDPRSRELAQRLWQESGNPEGYIAKVLERFRTLGYEYTLNPPAMGASDTLDAFLFDAKRGFCAHYAGSFVFLMRAVGIPARVVVGYQGGEWNAAGNYLAVQQRDAHAWVEVWLAGQGWVRVDPTTAVAPSRAERGLEAAVPERDLPHASFSPRKLAWLNGIRQQIDALQYGWQRWVLGYDREAQAAFLRNLLGTVSLTKVALLLAGLVTLIALGWLLSLGLLRRHTPVSVEQQLYQRFCAALAKRGVVREVGDAPTAFAERAAAQLPALAEVIHAFTATYQDLCYANAERQAATRCLRRLLRQLG